MHLVVLVGLFFQKASQCYSVSPFYSVDNCLMSIFFMLVKSSQNGTFVEEQFRLPI